MSAAAATAITTTVTTTAIITDTTDARTTEHQTPFLFLFYLVCLIVDTKGSPIRFSESMITANVVATESTESMIAPTVDRIIIAVVWYWR